MELKEIQALIKFVSESGVDEVELEKKDFKLSIKKVKNEVPVIAQPQILQATVPQIQAPVMPAAPAVQVSAPAAEAKKVENSASPAEGGNIVAVKSPMIGTFYRASGPDKPSFVNVGDEIKAGQVVCIIEAMKLFNEIESEISGKVVKVLVDNSSPVEYDQPLFLVEVK